MIQCNACNHLQIAFGTTALVFTKDEFYDFCEIVEEEKNEFTGHSFPGSKSIVVPTKNKDIALVFSYGEILKLHELVSCASILLQAEEILNGNEADIH